MQLRSSITIMLVFGLLLFTLICGTVVWISLGYDFFDALFRASLAFIGDGIYARTPVTENLVLSWTRFTGLLTTVATIIAVLMVFLHEKWRNLWARLRKHHIVVAGANRFTLDRYEAYAAERNLVITVIDTAERLNILSPNRDSTILLPIVTFEKAAAKRAIGRGPSLIVFGDRNTPLNLQRAQIMDFPYKMAIRIEDSSISRDLGFLVPELTFAEVFSISQTIARALVTEMAPINLAHIRQQDRVHVAIVGLGSVGLAIAEELALRCHIPELERVMLSVFDSDINTAKKRLQSQRAGLANCADIAYYELDGLQCAEKEGLNLLCKLEDKKPFTAIIIATGADSKNTGIALRMRQIQSEQLCLKAPIFVHLDNKISTKPMLINDLTVGVTVFGGRRPQKDDAGLEAFRESLAQELHETWLSGQPDEVQKSQVWGNLGYSERRSSYRAALSAVEMLQTCGLRPDSGSGIACMRVPPKLVHHLLTNPLLIDRLSRNEHQRWVAEKLADGYMPQLNGPRDNEKKLHPLIRPFDDLSKADQKKDTNVVIGVLKRCAKRFENNPETVAWRLLLRVGIYGVLDYNQATNAELTKRFSKFIAELPMPISAYSLEIVTPDAPGFDRSGARVLAEQWQKLAKRKASILAVHAASEAALNSLAAPYVSIATAEKQSAKMLKSVGGAKRMIDMRPTGISDADLINELPLFYKDVEAIGAHINAISDLVIAVVNKNPASYSRKALEDRIKSGEAFIEIEQG